MQFFKNIIVAVSVLASMVSAGAITFVNQNGDDRQIIFTANAGLPEVETLDVPGWGSETAHFSDGWTGNFFCIMKGAEATPGVLGEFAFDAWDGNTFFDVSAIVSQTDNDGIKMIFPKLSNLPMSGCQDYPCPNVYNAPNDIATMSSTEKEFVCLIGTLDSTKRRRRLATRSVAAEKMTRTVPLTDDELIVRRLAGEKMIRVAPLTGEVLKQ